MNLCMYVCIYTSACPYVCGRPCVPVRMWPSVRGRTWGKKKLSNRMPETTTTQAVPSLSRARTCVYALYTIQYIQLYTLYTIQ